MIHQVYWQPGMTLEALEKHVILRCLSFYGNNKTKTAEALGIAIRTIDNKLEKYRQEEQQEKEALERVRQKEQEFAQRALGKSSVRSSNTFEPFTDGNQIPSYDGKSTVSGSAEPEMSMQKRTEVQEMLPIQTTKLGAKRARG